MSRSPLALALIFGLFLCCITPDAQATGAAEQLRRAPRNPGRVLRGGPHGPDGRPYDADRTVRVPDMAKAAAIVAPEHAGAGHRLVVSAPDKLARATGGAALISGPRIQPLYLKGCPSEDFAAVANLGSGRGRQSLRLIVDSGSSTLAVASNQCKNCNVTPAYEAVTATTDNISVQALYGSGAWRGVIVNDDVALGFAPAKNIAFGDILLHDHFFRSTGCTFGAEGQAIAQGIVGMGPPDLLLPGTASYFMSVTPALQEPVYSVALCDIDGYLHLGPAPAGLAVSDPVYTPMVPSYYYAVGVADMEVGSRPLGAGYDDFGPAVVDTGTSAIILPPRAYKAFTRAVAKASDNVLPTSFFDEGQCAELPPDISIAELNSELPSMGFAFYNPATPKEPSWVSFPATGSYLLLLANTNQRLIVCAGVVNSGEEYPQTILGNTIMRNMLTTFDLANGRIGFAATQQVCD